MVVICKGLDDQQINHQIYLKLKNMICLTINYILYSKKKFHIFCLLNFGISLDCFFFVALVLKEINTVKKWLSPSNPLNITDNAKIKYFQLQQQTANGINN